MSNCNLSLQGFLVGAAVAPVVLCFGLYVATVYVVTSASVLLYVLLRARGVPTFALWGAVISLILGYVFSFGLLLCITGPSSWKALGIYMCSLAAFHYSEYFCIAVNSPKTLSMDSFLLYYSYLYPVSLSLSFIEYFIERYFYPEMKELGLLAWIGFAIYVSGEVIRKLAIFTTQSNFRHVVQTRLTKDNVLITHGVYAFCRHPSYLGFIISCAATQIVLRNPICVVVYPIFAWIFVNGRLPDEELSLLNNFGEEYVKYQKRVPSGLPFVRGYRLDK